MSARGNEVHAFVSAPTRRAEKPVAACVHRWRIAEPSGPTVDARCQSCGAQRVFRTVYEQPAEFKSNPGPGVPLARDLPAAARRRARKAGEGLAPLEAPPRVECPRCGLQTHWGAPMASHARRCARLAGEGKTCI